MDKFYEDTLLQVIEVEPEKEVSSDVYWGILDNLPGTYPVEINNEIIKKMVH